MRHPGDIFKESTRAHEEQMTKAIFKERMDLSMCHLHLNEALMIFLKLTFVELEVGFCFVIGIC